MAKIGSFGTIVKKSEAVINSEVEYDTFDWFDEEIRLRSWVSPLPMSRFAQILDSDKMRVNLPAASAIYSVLEGNILPEDWTKFEAVSSANDATLDLMEELAEHLFIRWCNSPTQKPLDSLTGGVPVETAATLLDESSVSLEDSMQLVSENLSIQEVETTTSG